jgi:hypothetical protein
MRNTPVLGTIQPNAFQAPPVITRRIEQPYPHKPLVNNQNPVSEFKNPSAEKTFIPTETYPLTERKYIAPPRPYYPQSDTKYSPSPYPIGTTRQIYTPLRGDNPYNQPPVGSLGARSPSPVQPMSARQTLPYTPTGSVDHNLTPRDYRQGSLEPHRTPTIIRRMTPT